MAKGLNIYIRSLVSGGEAQLGLNFDAVGRKKHSDVSAGDTAGPPLSKRFMYL